MYHSEKQWALTQNVGEPIKFLEKFHIGYADMDLHVYTYRYIYIYAYKVLVLSTMIW